MNKLKNYLKYYSLEKYLFDEVNRNFQSRGYLKSEEFFAIVIWKSNRAKTKVLAGIKKTGKTIRQITEEIAKASPTQKLEILLNIEGIGIPIASAILTVCYPDDFTVVDYRSIAAIKSLGEEVSGKPTDKPANYHAYVGKCKELAKQYDCSLRDFDRMLWGKDFYKDLIALVEKIDPQCR